MKAWFYTVRLPRKNRLNWILLGTCLNVELKIYYFISEKEPDLLSRQTERKPQEILVFIITKPLEFFSK